MPNVSFNSIDQRNSTKQWFQSPFGCFPQSEYSNNSQCLSTCAVIIASDKIKKKINKKHDQFTSIFVFCVNVYNCPGCPLAPILLYSSVTEQSEGPMDRVAFSHCSCCTTHVQYIVLLQSNANTVALNETKFIQGYL